MFVIKAVGGVFLLSIGTYSACRIMRYERQRLNVLDAWIELILYIRTEIDYHLTPLDEIVLSAPRRLTDRLGGKAPKNLTALLLQSGSYLNVSAYEQIEMLIGKLGTTYREEQIKLCDYRLSMLRSLRERTAAELPMRQKRGMTLSLCAALGIAILLW